MLRKPGGLRAAVGAACLIAATATAAPVRDPLAVSRDAKWTADKAAHLLRRAGFGGTPEQIAHLTRLGRDEAVNLLVDYEGTVQDDPDYPRATFTDPLPRRELASLPDAQRRDLSRLFQVMSRQHGESMREWWLRRMVMTSRPLEEKMTLFWHGHFTSGLREVKRAGLMHEQNGFLRTHALSDFRTLLRGISRDAAMLVYLDNGKNVKGRPNENYARELMELFTMGEGHYTEQDVREAARAFTGWASGPRGFVVQASRHDDGEKTFLGRTGQFDGDDIIEIILEQPATAEYLARKLWAFFVESEPDETIVQRLAETIRLTDYDLREAMRTILSSDAFYGPRARFALVKSPVELMAGTLRRLAIPPGDLRAANDVLRQMGQELFQPPNVKGWDGGRAWISTNTLFARYNAMSGVIRGTGNDPRRFAMQERFGARLASLGIGTADDDEGQAMPARPLARGMAAEGKAAFAGLTEEKMIELAEAVEGLDERARARLREVQLPPQYSGPQPAYDPLPVIQRHQLATPAMIVNHYVDRLLQMPIPDDRRLVLVQVLSGQDPTFDPTAPAVLERVRGVVLLIMSMPEYQLN